MVNGVIFKPAGGLLVQAVYVYRLVDIQLWNKTFAPVFRMAALSPVLFCSLHEYLKVKS